MIFNAKEGTIYEQIKLGFFRVLVKIGSFVEVELAIWFANHNFVSLVEVFLCDDVPFLEEGRKTG